MVLFKLNDSWSVAFDIDWFWQTWCKHLCVLLLCSALANLGEIKFIQFFMHGIMHNTVKNISSEIFINESWVVKLFYSIDNGLKYLPYWYYHDMVLLNKFLATYNFFKVIWFVLYEFLFNSVNLEKGELTDFCSFHNSWLTPSVIFSDDGDILYSFSHQQQPINWDHQSWVEEMEDTEKQPGELTTPTKLIITSTFRAVRRSSLQKKAAREKDRQAKLFTLKATTSEIFSWLWFHNVYDFKRFRSIQNRHSM